MVDSQLFLDIEAGGRQRSRYEQHRDRMARTQAEMSAEGRDIGEIPAIANPDRRESCRRDLRKFCETYFPGIFYLPWSAIQLETIKRLQAASMSGGKFAIAMPRGTGKSVLCERAAIWAAVYGYRRFIVIIGASSKATDEVFGAIKKEFECNEDFMEDFPEVCYPVQALDGIVNRCKGQTWHGARTHIVWSNVRLVLPTIGDAPTSGTVIGCASMTGRIRGMKYASANGDNLRPDFVLIDDPQTRSSARSVSQIKYRMNLISSDIVGMAGPGKKITAVLPCTVIYPNDLADQLLDRELNPEWSGLRYPLLRGFPKNLHLWQRYWELRSDGKRHDRGTDESTRFYIANQAEMDEGCEATWPERFESDEISGIQYGMNLYFSDRQKFFSEYQNEPEADDMGDGEKITADMILDCMNKRSRLEIPQAAARLTMAVDVQKNLLYWTVMAFDDNFTGWLIDYGVFPDQPREIFTTRDAAPTYRDVFPGAGQEGALTAALQDLIVPALGKSYLREDGGELSIGRCLIDSGWGETADTIYNFVRESGYASIIMPSKGLGIDATGKPISEYRRKPGEITSPYEWVIAPIKNKRHVRLFRYDTNYWKSFFRNRLLTSRGDPGAFSIFGERINDRTRLLADQLASEYSVTTKAKGRRVDAWKLTPTKENHWFDTTVGCMVAASEQGCRLIVDQPTAAGKEPRLVAAPRGGSSGRKIYKVGKVYGIAN